MIRAVLLLALASAAVAQSYTCYKNTASGPSGTGSLVYTWAQTPAPNTYPACYSYLVSGAYSFGGYNMKINGRYGDGLSNNCAGTNLTLLAQQQTTSLNNYYNNLGFSGSVTVGTPVCCEASYCNGSPATDTIGGSLAISGASITSMNAILMAVLVACSFLLTSKLA